jgi:DNA repair exonuclease SbcCD ATPase subunit
MLNSHNHTYVTDEMNVTHNTVILSQLSPYRDTNDERKSDILEGEKGYKEIWYEKGKHTFKIKHFYGNSSSQNKSFIEKDGKELNEKGNITTCYEIIERELSISRDYFTIGRLGSNVSNFIDLKTTDRKTYINKFVPNIDEFLNKFELVDDKYKKLDRKLKGIKLDLEKYPELDILEEIKKTNEDKLETIEKLKEKIITDKSSLKLKMESMNKELSDLYENSGLSELGISIEEFKNLDNLLEKYKVDLDQSNRVGNDLLNRFSSLASYDINKCNTSIEEFKESIIKNENEIELLNKDKYYLGKELFNLDTEIDDNKDKLESMKSKYNSDNEKILIKDKKESLESLNESLNDTIEEYNLNNVVLTSDINYSVIDDKVNTLLNAYSNMKESSPLSNEVINYIDEILEKNNFNLDSVLDLINRNIKDNYNSLESEKNLFSDAQKDYMKVNSNSSLLKILEVSDHHDHVKDCPFVGMALSFEENSYNNIGDLEIKLDKLSKSIHKRETDIKYFYEIKEVISSWKTTLNNTFSSEDINSFIFDYLKMDIIDLTRLLTSSTIIIDKSINLNNGYKKAFIDVNNIIKIEEDIAKLEDKIEVSIRMENEMINISNNINVLELKKSEVSKSNLNISNKIQEMNKTSLKLNKQLEIVNKLLDHLVTKNEIEVILSKSEESLEKQKSLKKSIEENRRSVSDLIIEMDKNKEVEVSTRAKLDEVKQEIFLVTRNMKEMKAINSIISPLSKISFSFRSKIGFFHINIFQKSSEKIQKIFRNRRIFCITFSIIFPTISF